MKNCNSEIHPCSSPISVLLYVYWHTLKKLSGVLKYFCFNSQNFLKNPERSPVFYPHQCLSCNWLSIHGWILFWYHYSSVKLNSLAKTSNQVCFPHILYIFLFWEIVVPFHFYGLLSLGIHFRELQCPSSPWQMLNHFLLDSVVSDKQSTILQSWFSSG